MANLSHEQQRQVESWAEGGATLNDIQSRLKSEFGIALTYLDARMLMIETGIHLKEKAKALPRPDATNESVVAAPSVTEEWSSGPSASGSVKVTADSIPSQGFIASGKATFSDGMTAAWFVDEGGRLGLRASDPAYQPPPGDIPVFEQQLDALLQSL